MHLLGDIIIKIHIKEYGQDQSAGAVQLPGVQEDI
jgi:hypothetical protein